MHRNSKWKNWILKIYTFLFLLTLTGCQATEIIYPTEAPSTKISSPKEETAVSQIQEDQTINKTGTTKVQLKKGKSYSSKDEVASYIHEFQELPANYITKLEAQKLGWDNSKGNLWKVTNQKSIGGDGFANREGLLPKASGRKYYECDINYKGGYRGAERVIYSNDGLIFYTDDHYETFKQLY